jgi:hypothetical protein
MVVLIPKNNNPQCVTDFKLINLSPIVLQRSCPIFLANRLAPELDNLISINQTTFIKKGVSMIILSMSSKSLMIFKGEKFLHSSLNWISPKHLTLSTGPTSYM